jgi:hypothetical protein
MAKIHGCVAKNKLRHKNAEGSFSSGGNLEEIGHESYLPANVAFPNSFNLALSDDVHCLVPADGPPRRIEAAKAESDSQVNGRQICLVKIHHSVPVVGVERINRATSSGSSI